MVNNATEVLTATPDGNIKLTHDVSVVGLLQGDSGGYPTLKGAIIHRDDYGDPSLKLQGQKSTGSDKHWGEYGVVANAYGIDIINTQTNENMLHIGGGGGNSTGVRTTFPHEVVVHGQLQIEGGSPASNKFLKSINAFGTGEWDYITSDNLPNLNASKITDGTLSVQRVGSVSGTGNSYNDATTWLNGEGIWKKLPASIPMSIGVSSGVPLTFSTSQNVMAVDPKTIAPNLVFARPSDPAGGNQPASMRTLTTDDLPMSSIVTAALNNIATWVEGQYYSKTQVDGNTMGVCYTKTESDANFYSKTDMDSIFGGYQQAGSAVDFGTMESYVSSVLGSYVTSSSLSSTLSNYIAWSAIDSYLLNSYGLTKL